MPVARITLLLVSAALALLVGPGAAHAQSGGGSQNQPNVVVMMTDDQDEASMREMPILDDRMRDRGVTFRNFFATFPLCCPSRVSFLTGQYAHNHGIFGNMPPDGFEGFQESDGETLPIWLRRAGYRTGFVGKYLNGYDETRRRYIPPGWDEWVAPVDQTAAHMFNYTLNENGDFERYGDKTRDYQTDVYKRKAVRFIDQAPRADPFFLSVSPLAPHGEIHRKGKLPNPRPAPRHEARFEGVPLPRGPSFNEFDVRDKPYFVKDRLSRDETAVLRERYQDRLASLLAVDDAVGGIIRELNDVGELDDTLFIFTSDNGYLLGEHRLSEKHWLYEESVQVPTAMRGPGVAEGETIDELAANIDLAPTILDAANAQSAGREVDGLSLMPLAREPGTRFDRDILLENNLGSRAIRTERFMYAEHSMEDKLRDKELYDLGDDPFQLQSLHDKPSSDDEQSNLASRLDALRDCHGTSGPEACR